MVNPFFFFFLFKVEVLVCIQGISLVSVKTLADFVMSFSSYFNQANLCSRLRNIPT